MGHSRGASAALEVYAARRAQAHQRPSQHARPTPRAERKHISVRASTRDLFVKAAVRDDVAPIHYLDAFITAELDKAGAP